MAVKQFLWKRPLVVGGLGLSASLWLLEASHLSAFDGSTWLSALALGSGVWWWRQRTSGSPASPRPVAAPVVDRARVEAQIGDLRSLIETLAKETAFIPESEVPALVVGIPTRMATYEAQCQALAHALDRTNLTGVVLGERRSGKSTLIQHLTTTSTGSLAAHREGDENVTSCPVVTWTEVLPVESALIPSGAVEPSPTEFNPAESNLDAVPAALDAADVVLWVTDGDLTASALGQLRQRVIAGQGVIVAFNKTDHYAPTDRLTVLTQLQRQGESLPGSVKVVAVAANPRPITVRRHQAEGGMEEFQEAVPPQLADLDQALSEVLQQGPTWVAATTLRQGEALRQRIQQDINQVRRQRAMPLIDQLQWVAAAAALANPVPTLDVLATVAINGQLMMDLGKIYGFNLSLEDAKAAASTLAGLTVKLGLVELSTQALTLVLKSHFATYLAGGMVQGLSAAYLTRMAGLSLIDYFEQAALAGTPTQALSWDAIAQRLSTVIQQNRQIGFLQNLVKQGISILQPAQTPALMTATTQEPLSLTVPAPEPLTVSAQPVQPAPLPLNP
ncbi:DUF697 domain-containing protein [Leptolyngbya sp. BL0902]|uniref:DUF697 domain-containing protein n=1 Tax=Leptolyngbya sp. BL0902 TaxID=1115757 RepID=UPI0018E6FE05|nr:DUF697 domain-containing protein [Leptolyngbya sp. BL0902]